MNSLDWPFKIIAYINTIQHLTDRRSVCMLYLYNVFYEGLMNIARIVKKPENRRKEIIQAARKLFMTQDYDKTSMQDIINYLGIAKGTIYHYFSSKEALLQAVIEDVVDDTIEQMNLVLQASGTALEKIKRLVQLGNVQSSHEKIIDSLHRDEYDSMHTRLLVAMLLKQVPLYAQLIEQGCQEGVFETKYPLQAAEFILFAVQFLTDKGIHAWSQEDISQRMKAFPRFVEQILQASENSFDFLKQ